MFIGNKETQKAAAQQVIELQAHLNRVRTCCAALRKVVSGNDLELIKNINNDATVSEEELSRAFDADCRSAFTEE